MNVIIHNNAKSNKLEDQVFWYKASAHDDFRIGNPDFWRHHNNLYSGSTQDEDKYG